MNPVPVQILFVEDSEDDAALVLRQLENSGFNVKGERVMDGPEMSRAMTGTRYDVILCDHKLPAFDAFQALELLRQHDGGIPLIVVSGFVGEEAAVDLMRRGARDFVHKQKLDRLGPVLARELEDARQRAERRRAEESVARQLRRITALRNIDLAITGSLDIRVVLNVILDQIVTLLDLDAAAVLLLNSQTDMLEFAAGRGFKTDALKFSRLRLGEGYAGRSLLTRRLLHVADLRSATGELKRSKLLANEGFITYFAIPLVARGVVKGVIEAFTRHPKAVDPEWTDFLETLAGQAAIAIESAATFDQLQRANTELEIAYDSTLEGWSRALDLRDKETEGHSDRVTQMTVQLARLMGLSEADIKHIRRGALLHDIGKLGIPDSILLKPGPLADEEWAIMKLHPVHAHNWLSPITYLRPALHIPWCHHEKWDGTGYPRGLKGEAIPLAARIFAVVDVYDALSSNRPYRNAWPRERVFDHITSLAGSHFEPAIVDAFLRLTL